ncbi:MAG: heme ABC exporter ATP-binding protein CcmA, partial [Pseudomonadota bacterium]
FYIMLSCINIGLELNNKTVLKSLTLSLLPGSIYVLKGANGSGKTSLLQILAGLKSPTEGNLLWNNKAIDYELYHKNIVSYLGHEIAIKKDLSVFDNLLLWSKLKSSELLLNPAISHFQLTEMEDIQCKYLSAGWQKRVALARMIISNTQLWLLDEPEANLDEKGMELLLQLLQAKIASGGMAIIASHNQSYYNKIPIINVEDYKT